MENRKELNLDEMEQVSGGNKEDNIHRTKFVTKGSSESRLIKQGKCPSCHMFLKRSSCYFCMVEWIITD